MKDNAVKEAKVFGSTAVLAGFFAAACCWGPVLLAALGASSLAFSPIAETLRPFALVLACIALAIGFWREFRPKASSCNDAACAPRQRWAARTVLFLAAGAVLFFAFFPVISGGKQKPASPPTTATRQVLLEVRGMTCQACERTVERSLEELPGVLHAQADRSKGTVVVWMDPSRKQLDELVKAVRSKGYEASEQVGEARP